MAHCKGEVVCATYSISRCTGTNTNVQLNRQIQDAGAFPAASFPFWRSHFSEKDANTEVETKTCFYEIKGQSAVFTTDLPGLNFCCLSAALADILSKRFCDRTVLQVYFNLQVYVNEAFACGLLCPADGSSQLISNVKRRKNWTLNTLRTECYHFWTNIMIKEQVLLPPNLGFANPKHCSLTPWVGQLN